MEADIRFRVEEVNEEGDIVSLKPSDQCPGCALCYRITERHMPSPMSSDIAGIAVTCELHAGESYGDMIVVTSANGITITEVESVSPSECALLYG